MTAEPKYPIGQQYTTRDRRKARCTMVDIHRTYNAAGEMVKLRYVVEHMVCGMPVTDRDVCETTITMALGV